MKVIVPDTGILIDGRVSELVAQGRDKYRIVVDRASIAELENQANSGRETGIAGLDELKKLTDLSKQGKIEMELGGSRPTAGEARFAKLGEIDAKIRMLAREVGGVLLTTDKINARMAEVEGIEVEYFPPIVGEAKLLFEKFFDKQTLSVHVKEGCKVKAKVGFPGNFKLKELPNHPEVQRSEIEDMMREAIEFAKRNKRCFIEIDKEGATVLQIQDYRVTFTKPPFSEAAEVTIVRPIVKLKLSDYNLPQQLKERLEKQAEGIIIAGPPGSGKSTFATALAENYAQQGKIVKTLEQPRDLQVSKEITQYAPLEGSFEQVTDILLLVRPDYSIFDEVRKQIDFTVFSDLRLAGIGMMGVVHASKPIDAVQRFLGKVEMGLIPQVVDTVIFINAGKIEQVYSLASTIKVPAGMREQDLTRPVIQILDLLTGEVKYEIYKFGEETVVAGMSDIQGGSGGRRRKSARHERDSGSDEGSHPRGSFSKIDLHKAEKVLRNYLHGFELQDRDGVLVVRVPERSVAKIIGKKGATIAKIEREIGCQIDVEAV
jgi:ATPase